LGDFCTFSILAPSITFFHFSVSAANIAELLRRLDQRLAAEFNQALLHVGSARIAFTSTLSLAMISFGVFFGAPMPNNALASQPGTVAATVGTPAIAGRVQRGHRQRAQRAGTDVLDDRGHVVRRSPALAAEHVGDRGRSHGRARCILVPVMAMNISPDRCTEMPLPDDARLTARIRLRIGDEPQRHLSPLHPCRPSSRSAPD
jgi:hypothetical protein